jgi:hypothetical protein
VASAFQGGYPPPEVAALLRGYLNAAAAKPADAHTPKSGLDSARQSSRTTKHIVAISQRIVWIAYEWARILDVATRASIPQCGSL